VEKARSSSTFKYSVAFKCKCGVVAISYHIAQQQQSPQGQTTKENIQTEYSALSDDTLLGLPLLTSSHPDLITMSVLQLAPYSRQYKVHYFQPEAIGYFFPNFI
jgi:hypothetical protein